MCVDTAVRSSKKKRKQAADDDDDEKRRKEQRSAAVCTAASAGAVGAGAAGAGHDLRSSSGIHGRSGAGKMDGAHCRVPERRKGKIGKR
ncbi:hypothetical protein PR202_ga11136 [Eleusine coracana subsp. coracana]|uniref:Uncharacterized protein n=1 Tax=Eleusine coracana subsp. coracana TaxID=191504 RepID=A0AAV5C8M6_ELECO|nr:hypothetical protein PR202_ga11136 [Eleusine coracana subsp. coracana]